jgi:hypothetical protein
MIVGRRRAIRVPDEDGGPVSRYRRIDIRISIMILEEYNPSTTRSSHCAADGVADVEGVRLASGSVAACGIVPITSAMPKTIIIKRKSIYRHNFSFHSFLNVTKPKAGDGVPGNTAVWVEADWTSLALKHARL